MKVSSRLISLLFVCFCFAKASYAQLPAVGASMDYNASIEFKKAYISGIAMIANEDKTLAGCIFNEFGVSAFSFQYDKDKERVSITHIIPKLNKWYIKKVLKKDIRQLLHEMSHGNNTYTDTKFNIKYTFTPFEDDAKE